MKTVIIISVAVLYLICGIFLAGLDMMDLELNCYSKRTKKILYICTVLFFPVLAFYLVLNEIVNIVETTYRKL